MSILLIKFLILFFNCVSLVLAKEYDECEFVRELVEVYGLSYEDALGFTCVASETSKLRSTFATSSNGKKYFGIFGISEEKACSFSKPKFCRVTCDKFLDEDIRDDLDCVKKILSETTSRPKLFIDCETQLWKNVEEDCGREIKDLKDKFDYNTEFFNLQNFNSSNKKHHETLIPTSAYSPQNCGMLRKTYGFIIDGDPADKNRWPWIGAMFVKHKYSCTVNFISDSRAVTVAHCFIKVGKPNDIALLIFSGRYIGVKKYELHPRFKSVPEYDIAILDTDTITDTGFVPVCLTENLKPVVGIRGNVFSYTPAENDDVNLLNGKFFIAQKSYCQNVTPNVPEHSFCVLHGHKDTWLCKGDSGAGFITLSEKSNDRRKGVFLRGIVSTGVSDQITGDCTIEDFVIFTDVTKFISFITSD